MTSTGGMLEIALASTEGVVFGALDAVEATDDEEEDDATGIPFSAVL